MSGHNHDGTASEGPQISLTAGVSGTLPEGSGGTNATTYTDGQILIGNSSDNGLDKATLTAGSSKLTIVNGNGTITLDVANASVSQQGAVEIATITETNTGTASTLATSPDSISQSYAGTKEASFVTNDLTADLITGDNQAFIKIPPSMDGMNLVGITASVDTAGVTGSMQIQISNTTQAADMLSTLLTFASGATNDNGTVVIDTGNDDVASGDIISLDIDTIQTTAAKGLVIVMEFRLP